MCSSTRPVELLLWVLEAPPDLRESFSLGCWSFLNSRPPPSFSLLSLLSLLPWFPWLHLPLQGGRSQGLSCAAPAPHPPSPRPLLPPVAAAPAHVSMPLSSTPLVPTIPGPQVHESSSVLTPQHHKLDQTNCATLPHVAIPFLYRQLLNLETSPWLITLSVAEIAPKSIFCISVPNYPSLGQFL